LGSAEFGLNVSFQITLLGRAKIASEVGFSIKEDWRMEEEWIRRDDQHPFP
jgi:hypothetical protein